MCSLYLPLKIYPVCINSTPTAYATIDTIIIQQVYKPDFAVCVLFSPTGSWDRFAIKSAAVFSLVFFQVNDSQIQNSKRSSFNVASQRSLVMAAHSNSTECSVQFSFRSMVVTKSPLIFARLQHRSFIICSFVLLYANKHVNVVLCKSVDLVQLVSNVSDRPGAVEQAKYNNSSA